MDQASWRRIASALDFYARNGYEFVSVPWHVPQSVAAVTCGTEERMFHLREYGVLVGSAEQSFIGSQIDGNLRRGRFVGVSPCFRNEGADRDSLHDLYFMKVELYSTLEGRRDEDRELAEVARAFLLSQIPDGRPVDIDLVTTTEGFDLEIGGIEVGSYSCRAHGKTSWTCGTGLAEPRFSMAVTAACGSIPA